MCHQDFLAMIALPKQLALWKNLLQKWYKAKQEARMGGMGELFENSEAG